MTQVTLASNLSRLVTWLEVDPRIKIGTKLTLRGMDDRWWVVESIGTVTPELEKIHADWKVGGLS